MDEPPGVLPDSRSLEQFLLGLDPLLLEERFALVEQATILLEGLYVHLRLKEAMHAVDPLQRLRLLHRRLAGLSELQFHSELIATFTSLRDLHTVYQLPEPFRGHVASLGFLVEGYFPAPDEPRRFIVSKVHPDLATPEFREGVEVVSWNGVPIERALELNADRQAGSNPDARIARGLEALTLRPLRTRLPPDEHWVVIGYRAARRSTREIRLSWRIVSAASVAATHTDGAAGPVSRDPINAISATLGIDVGSESTRQSKRMLFAPERAQKAVSGDLRDLIWIGALPSPKGELGYLRIFSFNTANPEAFVSQLARVLSFMPKRGLVIDIRANPGGHIPAAEGLLQLLTGAPIEPIRFSLATTPLVLALCDANPALKRWAESVALAPETAESHSQPLPLSDPERLAGSNKRYLGPKILITDPISYSAADIFAAGFQDNGIGEILGTGQSTGAGGANVWTHELLRVWLSDTLGDLPRGASFRVALRRATRVKAKQGVPLEDLGVQSDHRHWLTKRDLTKGNQDLLAAAAGLL